MIFRKILPLLFFITPVLFAQVEFDYSGYIYELPIYQNQKEEFAKVFGLDRQQFISLTRLRIRPVLYLWEGARFNLEYELNAVYLSSQTNFDLTQTEKTNRQIADMNWEISSGDHLSLSHFVDRLSFRQGFDFGNITVGRQRISWGTGRIWNPTDLFNPINPASFFKVEKDGADAVSFKYNIADFTDAQIVYNPTGKLTNGNYAARLRTNFNEYDVSVMAGSFDNRTIIGGDFAGNLSAAGVRGEGIYSVNSLDKSDYYFYYILGIDFQFTAELYTVLEYSHNGQGTKDISKYDINRLAKGEILNLNQDYLYFAAMYQLSPLWMFSASNISNVNDGSGFVALLANYSFTEDLYFSFGGQFFFGPERSEYWFYSSAGYRQGEYYF